MPRRILVLTVALAALPGCLGTRTERVKVRRDPAIIEQNQRAMRPLTPSEIEELFAREAERRRVRPDVERWNEHYRRTRAVVGATLAGVPRDPWRSEELDRRRVLVRPWADVGTKRPPDPEPLPEPRGEFADEQDGLPPLPPRGQGGSGEEGDEDGSYDDEGFDE